MSDRTDEDRSQEQSSGEEKKEWRDRDWVKKLTSVIILFCVGCVIFYAFSGVKNFAEINAKTFFIIAFWSTVAYLVIEIVVSKPDLEKVKPILGLVAIFSIILIFIFKIFFTSGDKPTSLDSILKENSAARQSGITTAHRKAPGTIPTNVPFYTVPFGEYQFSLKKGEKTSWLRIPENRQWSIGATTKGCWDLEKFKGKTVEFKPDKDVYVDFPNQHIIFKIHAHEPLSFYVSVS